MSQEKRPEAALREAAALVGIPAERLARLAESSDPEVRRAAAALVTGPRAARLRAFIARSRAAEDAGQ